MSAMWQMLLLGTKCPGNITLQMAAEVNLRNLALVRLLSVERTARTDPMARIGGFSGACITGILAHWRWAGRKMQSTRSATTEVKFD